MVIEWWTLCCHPLVVPVVGTHCRRPLSAPIVGTRRRHLSSWKSSTHPSPVVWEQGNMKWQWHWVWDQYLSKNMKRNFCNLQLNELSHLNLFSFPIKGTWAQELNILISFYFQLREFPHPTTFRLPPCISPPLRGHEWSWGARVVLYALMRIF